MYVHSSILPALRPCFFVFDTEESIVEQGESCSLGKTSISERGRLVHCRFFRLSFFCAYILAFACSKGTVLGSRAQGTHRDIYITRNPKMEGI